MHTQQPRALTRILSGITCAIMAGGAVGCQSGPQNVANGSATDAKGKVESAVGDVTGSDSLKATGQMDQAKGDAQKTIGQAQEHVKSATTP